MTAMASATVKSLGNADGGSVSFGLLSHHGRRMAMSMNWEQLLSAERLGNRPAKSEEGRSTFYSDHDKIRFSATFRRLATKTQAHHLTTNDHVHSRLTHSLTVACVGR